ncbi:MAG: glycosyltransferase family 4 protein [Microcella sp.]|uniref:glycosyltransferase family 4 protein n=1 Tax=Microcella sp. TaxID=1913979 RepID=UPI003314A792
MMRAPQRSAPTARPAAFAIPGDIATLTGGYVYERRLLESLRALGREVRHVRLGASFPDPTDADVADTVAQLTALGEDTPIILDGFISGAMPTQSLALVHAPLIAVVHHPLALEKGLDDERRARLHRTERDNLALIEHVLVPSPHTAAMLTEHYAVPGERITVVRPGTDAPLGPGAPEQPPLILSVGIQHPRKGHDVLLAALAQLPDRPWRAVIVGSSWHPEHAAQLARQHAALGLGDRVRFAGRVDAAELSGLYRSATVFALATRYEGYGIVFDEALAHGLPIVSCAVGAVPDTVPADAGVLVPAEDPSALAAALTAVLTDPVHRARLAVAAARAGAALPRWRDAAEVVARVLDDAGR